MVELYADGFTTPGGKYRPVEFEYTYYKAYPDRITRVEKYSEIPEEETVYEFPCPLKKLISWPGRIIGTYDAYLADNRHVKITLTEDTVLATTYIDSPTCIKYPWYNTIGAALEFIGEKTLLGGREVTLKKNSIEGWKFPIKRGKIRITPDEYVLSFTHPIPEEALQKILDGERPAAQEILPGLPAGTKKVIVRGATMKAEVPGRFVPLKTGLKYTGQGIVYTNVIVREGILDVLIRPDDPLEIPETIDDVPDDNIVDFFPVPIVVDVLPERFEKLPGGDFVIVYQDFEIRTDGETTYACKGKNCVKIDASGLSVSEIMDLYYFLV